MKVLVVGAAGRTGRAVAEQAVAAGHQVTGLVRVNRGQQVPGIDVRLGDASDPAVVDDAIAGQDAVIDTVGGKTPYRRTTLETDVARTIIAAMQRRGLRRLIVTSSLGVGGSTANTPPLTKVVVATFLRGSTRDKAAMESAVRGSELDWVITRPAVLTDQPATGLVRVVTAGSHEQVHSITRTDLAAWLIGQLTDSTSLRQTVTLANR